MLLSWWPIEAKCARDENLIDRLSRALHKAIDKAGGAQ
jgi:hypothetical protein